ncbi:P-loop NTPase fold protein [Peribacillus frigoritolerans]|uniref:P-loop NTPase fold protein n=1 Tax=Peribacillus frigoritolerans TaxID=450367 RepID=UPI003CFCD1D1
MYRQQEQRESVGSSFVNDSPTLQDSLGFEPYIEGVANFIKDPATKAPLTISIEGEWGSGKSSFMKQLQERLKKSDPTSYSVWFDSWRYDKEEGMWAAFSLSFLQQISEQRSFLIRPWLRRRLRWRRLQKKESKFWTVLFHRLPIWLVDFLFLVFLVSLPIIYFGTIAQPLWNAFLNLSIIDVANQPIVELAVKLVPIFPWLILLFKEFRGTASGLLEQNLNKYINNPKYQDHLELINHFHKDFRLMIENYASNNRVYLYIDDLDRCDAGKAAELMQAINMMIHDYPQVIFVIAMDRKKVAAGYAMHHEKLLTYLAPSYLDEEGKIDPVSVAQQGLQYGYSYIEKFIQVPFRVPKPNQADVKRLLNLVVKKSNDPTNNLNIKKITIIKKGLSRFASWKFIKQQPKSLNINDKEERARGAKKIHQDNLRVLLDIEDSVAVKNVIAMIAPYLDYNPRRIKQFLNIFRLYGYLSDELGLLRHNNSSQVGEAGLSLEQLGKVVAMSLKWPQFMTEAIDNEKFIKIFLQYAYDEADENVTRKFGVWRNETKLIELLREGCEKPDGQIDSKLIPRFGLNEANFVELFMVAEPVFRSYIPDSINSTPIILKKMSQESFIDLVYELLEKYFDLATIEILNEEKWGKDFKILLKNGEALLVNIDNMFDMVDVHSVEYVTNIMDEQGIAKGIVITPGYFEMVAIQYAQQHNIELWDGKEFTSILKRYGYNVNLDTLDTSV